MATGALRPTIEFEPNVPVEVALKYAGCGKTVNTRFGERVMFTTADDRVMFLDKEQFAPQWLDLYDAELKYWKFYWNLYHPGLVPETGEQTAD